MGLLGYGTVGSGVGALLSEGAEDIQLATGKHVYLRKVLELPGFTHPDLDPRAGDTTSARSSTTPRSASSSS